MRKLLRRIHYLLNRRRLESELAEEMAAHCEMMPEDRRRNFGRPLHLREDARDVWTWVWIEQLWQDLSYGARMLWRSKGFTLGAIAVLALGVGVNLAEYQIFDAVGPHRLSIRNADSIVEFFRVGKSGRTFGFPPAAVEFYRANSDRFASITSEDTSHAALTVENDTEVRANFVSGNYFQTLRILPAWGRLLTEWDARAGAPPVIVLGYGYWQKHWAADQSVVGRVVHINSQLVQIVGVTPYDFDGISVSGTAVWAPSTLRPLLIEGSSPSDDLSTAGEALYALLKPGVSLAAGAAQLTALTHELSHREPRWFKPEERIPGRRLQELRGLDFSVTLVASIPSLTSCRTSYWRTVAAPTNEPKLTAHPPASLAFSMASKPWGPSRFVSFMPRPRLCDPARVLSFAGAAVEPSPEISVVTPWVILLMDGPPIPPLNIDKSRRDYQPFAVDPHFRLRAVQLAGRDPDDPVAAQRDIAIEPGIAGTVDDLAACENHVVGLTGLSVKNRQQQKQTSNHPFRDSHDYRGGYHVSRGVGPSTVFFIANARTQDLS